MSRGRAGLGEPWPRPSGRSHGAAMEFNEAAHDGQADTEPALDQPRWFCQHSPSAKLGERKCLGPARRNRFGRPA